MSDSDSDVGLGDTVTNPGRWPMSRIKLLIRLRLEMEEQFTSGRSRHLLWPQVYTKMKSADPALTETLKNVQKKFNNLMLTYKRIKAGSHSNNPSRWEFFEDFDKVLSEFSEIKEEDEQPNVHYVKIEKEDDSVCHLDDGDSVSFSSDDCDTRPNYKNIVAHIKQLPKQEISSNTHDAQAANGMQSEKIVAQAAQIKKRKLTNTGGGTVQNTESVGCTVQKKTKNSSSSSSSDDNAWFREYVKMNERKEQIRHNNLMEMERKKLEIETKKIHMLRELIDVVKTFVNK